MLGAGLVALALAGCDTDLVFENEFDPEASNSPLSTSVTNLYVSGFMNEFSQKTVDFGWDRVPQALSYEYEIVRIGWRDDTGADAFREVDSGVRDLETRGSLAQTPEGENPFDTAFAFDGVYAIRVRYLATATNNGVTSDAWSPWSPPVERGLGAELYYWHTRQLGRSDLYQGWFDFRGDRFIFEVDFAGFGAANNTMFLFIDDEFSGYENGADPSIRIYDAENSFNGPFFEGDFDFNKMENPVTFTMPPSERLFIVLESHNPDFTEFEIEIDF